MEGWRLRPAIGAAQKFRLLRRRGPERPVALYLAVRHTGLTLKEVGEYFGGVHYSSVSQAVGRMEAQLHGDGSLRRRVEQLEARLQTP